MGDFFLAQMNDSFTEGLCFDNRKEGEVGIAALAIPHSAKGSLR
jgi:hypothetical protein